MTPKQIANQLNTEIILCFLTAISLNDNHNYEFKLYCTHTTRSIHMSNKKHDILLIKNFSGGFNDEGIGHEIINYFDRNQNVTNFCYFYVPPYGSIEKEDESFFSKPIYRNIKIILVFDSTNITNVLKLKSVVLDPVPFDSFDEMMNCAREARYGLNNKALTDIDFKDKEYLHALSLESGGEIDEDLFVFPITYKVPKDKYYLLEDKNIFIWHSRSEKTNNLRQSSMEKFRFVYGEDATIKELAETTLGQKNYSYNLGDDLYDWFNDEIVPFLTEDNVWPLNSVEENYEFEFNYDKNNILAFLNKLNDENIYTNFIKGVLKNNEELLSSFFSFLVAKLFSVENYSPSNANVLTQQQSLIPEKKTVNSYLRNVKNGKVKAANRAKNKLMTQYGYTEEMLANALPFVDGQMDLYLYDDNYRIVVENKILSGLNGKRETIEGQITQLDTYRTYIDDLNSHNLERNKTNKVCLLVPDRLANNFVNYRISYGNPAESHNVPVLTYKDLARFFTEHQDLIAEEYRSDFLNVLYKQSYAREEEILNRFLMALDE